MYDLTTFPPRFASKVAIDANGCWIWQAYLNARGYGEYSHPDTKRMCRAHRYAYEFACGPIPEGLHIDHLCRVTACVNPAHLEPVTLAENARRASLALTACPAGHPYEGDNVYMHPRGYRVCRECRRIGSAAYRAADPERARAQAKAHNARARAKRRRARNTESPAQPSEDD